MRQKVTIGTLVTLCLALALGYYWHAHNTFSAAINRNSLRACEYRMPCTFTFGQLFPSDWDRVVVFDMSASQDEIDRVVGKGLTHPGLQRLVVFMRGSSVLRFIIEPQGVEHPEGSEVIFAGVPLLEHHLTILRDDSFVRTGGAPSCESCTTLQKFKPGEAVI